MLPTVLPERSDVGLVDVVDDDGGESHDLPRASGHESHGSHGEDQDASR